MIILDGGMGRELLRMGAPFKQPEWSALALMLAPETVAQAHRRFVEAGAAVITTNSYALVPFHVGEAKFAAEGRTLADLAGRRARKAVEGAGQPGPGALVCGGCRCPLAGRCLAAAFVPFLPSRPVRRCQGAGDHPAADRRLVAACRPVARRDAEFPGRSALRQDGAHRRQAPVLGLL